MIALVKRLIWRMVDIFVFLTALIRNPREMGAILPSSSRLAEEMVSHISMHGNDMVVDLGAGTGVVTLALIKAGIDPAKIIAIECSSSLSKKLQKRFPLIQVINGDAVDLSCLLGDKKSLVNTIVSGIPLRSLHQSVSQAILQQISNILPLGGRYIQFTYQYKQNLIFSPVCFKQTFSKIIWQNMPPARVDVFEI